MTTTPPWQQLEKRLDEVETKLAFSEDALDQLNEVVIQQQRLIDGLVAQLAELKQRVPEGRDDAPFALVRRASRPGERALRSAR